MVSLNADLDFGYSFPAQSNLSYLDPDLLVNTYK